LKTNQKMMPSRKVTRSSTAAPSLIALPSHKAIQAAFYMFIKNIWKDFMLAVCLFAPILMGLVFKIGVPILEKILCTYFHQASVLAPYYVLLDLLLSYMTPLMLCFAGVMVILEELDDGTAKYLLVTPLGKTGYLISRIGILSLLSIFYNLIIELIFSLSGMHWHIILVVAILNSILSIIVSMFVVAFAKNKVEGMALIKLSGFMILGLLAAFFIHTPSGYLAGILPSYWIGKLIFDDHLLFILPCLFICALWILLLSRKFNRRILN